MVLNAALQLAYVDIGPASVHKQRAWWTSIVAPNRIRYESETCPPADGCHRGRELCLRVLMCDPIATDSQSRKAGPRRLLCSTAYSFVAFGTTYAGRVFTRTSTAHSSNTV